MSEYALLLKRDRTEEETEPFQSSLARSESHERASTAAKAKVKVKVKGIGRGINPK